MRHLIAFHVTTCLLYYSLNFSWNLPFVATYSLHVSALCQLHCAQTASTRRWVPAIFCWIQAPVISSYIIATDLLKIYRVNSVNLLTGPHVKQLFPLIGHACQAGTRWTQSVTGMEVTNRLILHGVNVWPRVEKNTSVTLVSWWSFFQTMGGGILSGACTLPLPPTPHLTTSAST